MAAKPCAPPSFSFKKPAEPRADQSSITQTLVSAMPRSASARRSCVFFVDHRPVMISSTATAPSKVKHNLGWVGEAAERGWLLVL